MDSLLVIVAVILLALFSGWISRVLRCFILEWILTIFQKLKNKRQAKSAGKDAWRCGCGRENPNTALFCKDCGRYK